MKKSILILTLLSGLVILFTSSCNKEENQGENNDDIPTLTTNVISNISSTTATSGGNISSDGNSSVILRGVCWNTAPNPTIENNKTSDGTGMGNFSSTIEELSPSTTYYLRAYATNAVGTAYGNEITFTTINEDSQVTPQFDIIKVIDGKQIRDLIKTSDGGYIGITFAQDYEVIKFDQDFNTIWNKVYGGSKGDFAQSISPTLDGGYLVLGYSESNDGDVTGNHGDSDIWACKLDGAGNLVWQKSYGGSDTEGLGRQKPVLMTNDGGFIFTGYTKSNDGYDVWIVKADSNGDIQFEKTFGGNQDDYGRSIIKTNSNYTVLIKANSSNGDFNAPGNWVFQLGQNGDIIWKTKLSGINSGAISTTSDNKIIVVNNSSNQFLISKLDFSGNVIMSNIIDLQAVSNKQPGSIKIQETSDQGFIVIGDLGNGSDADALLFRLTPELNLLYNKIYSGNDLDMSATFIPLSPNNYLYQFFTFSHDIAGVQYSSNQASVIVKLEEIFN